MESTNPIVLVTGAAGYIGGHVVRLLTEKGFRVRAVFYGPAPPTNKLISTDQDSENLVAHDTQETANVNEATNLIFNQIKTRVDRLKEHLSQFDFPGSVEFLEMAYPPTNTPEPSLQNDVNIWKRAVHECTFVVHTAGPFFHEESDDFVTSELLESLASLSKTKLNKEVEPNVVADAATNNTETEPIGPDDESPNSAKVNGVAAEQDEKTAGCDGKELNGSGDCKAGPLPEEIKENTDKRRISSNKPKSPKTIITSSKDAIQKSAATVTPSGSLMESARSSIIQLLEACLDAGTVRRVVLTSSISTILGNPGQADIAKEYNENDWNQINGNQFASSDLASGIRSIVEKMAWDFVMKKPPTQLTGSSVEPNDQSIKGDAAIGVSDIREEPLEFLDALDSGGQNGNESFSLVILNPVLVLGPSINDNYTGPGFELIRKLLKREIPALPKVNFLIVDVRDLALAHYNALMTPEANGHRFIICNRGIWLKEMANVLNKEFVGTHHNLTNSNNNGVEGENGSTLAPGAAQTLPPVSSNNYKSNTPLPNNTTYYSLVPTLQCPSFLVGWLKTLYFESKTLKNYYLALVGKEIHVSNDKMKEYLKIIPRELHQTIVDTAQDLIDNGGHLIPNRVYPPNYALTTSPKTEMNGGVSVQKATGNSSVNGNNGGTGGYTSIFGAFLNKRPMSFGTEKKSSLKSSASLMESKKGSVGQSSNITEVAQTEPGVDDTGVTLLNEAAEASAESSTSTKRAQTLDGRIGAEGNVVVINTATNGRTNKLHHSLSMSRVKLFGVKGWHNFLQFNGPNKEIVGDQNGETIPTMNNENGVTEMNGDHTADVNKDKSETLKSLTSASSGADECATNSDHAKPDGCENNGGTESTSASANTAGPAASLKKGIKIAKKKWSLHYHHNPTSHKKVGSPGGSNPPHQAGPESSNLVTEITSHMVNGENENSNGGDIVGAPEKINGPHEDSITKATEEKPSSHTGGGLSGLTGMAKCFPHYFKTLVMDSTKSKSSALASQDNNSNIAAAGINTEASTGTQEAAQSQLTDVSLSPQIKDETEHQKSNHQFTSYLKNDDSHNTFNVVVDGSALSNMSIAKSSGAKTRLGLTPTPSPPPVVLISSRPITPDSERVILTSQVITINQGNNTNGNLTNGTEIIEKCISPITSSKSISPNNNPMASSLSDKRNSAQSYENYPKTNTANASNEHTKSISLTTAATTYYPTTHCRKESIGKNFVSSLQGVSITTSTGTPINIEQQHTTFMNGYHHDSEDDGQHHLTTEDTKNNGTGKQQHLTDSNGAESQSCSKSLEINA